MEVRLPGENPQMIDVAVILLCAVSFLAFFYSPLNAGYIVAALNALFVLFPMYLFVNINPYFLNYGMRSLDYSGKVAPYETTQLLLVGICACWLLGAMVAERVRVFSKGFTYAHGREKEISRKRALLLAGLVVAVFVIVVPSSDFSLMEALLPSRKRIEDVYGSYYISKFLIIAPASLAILWVLNKGRVDIFSFCMLLFSIGVVAGTGQRREIIAVITIYVLSILFYRFVSNRIMLPDLRSVIQRALKWRFRITLGVVSLLGPMLWFARSYFTQLFRDDTSGIINPWELRGFGELFFGSTASGFPATVLAHEIVSTSGVPWAYSFLFVISAPIPRAMWPEKPYAPGALLIDHFSLTFSPSLFLVADVLLNFYLFAPIMAFILAFLMTRAGKILGRLVFSRRNPETKHLKMYCMFLAIFLTHSIVIFKNGMAAFIVSLSMWFIVAWSVYMFISKTPVSYEKP